MAAKEATAVYATWTVPGAEFAVRYSLPLLHEIDFLVNEGYRRIPHGGIEIGGLLFGRFEGNSVRLDAFRSIECEHASGPSFTLSERDLAALRQQLRSVASDPELEGRQIVGWFVAHTRSELRMNEREAALFDEFFPEAGNLMLLVKPERFQATRFAFLIRGSDGQVNPDGTGNAIILPLPGQADREAASDGTPHITAPVRESPAPDADVFRPGERSRENSPTETLPQAFGEDQASRDASPHIEQPVGDAAFGERTERTVSNRLSMAIRREPAFPGHPGGQVEEKPGASPDISAAALVKTSTLAPLEEIRRPRSFELQRRALDPRDAQYQIGPPKQRRKRLNLRLATALLIAAMLGCALGYWTYQRVLPAAIPLTVEPRPSTLLVSWPVEQTRDAELAALRIDDGDPMPLTPEQKTAGEADISVAGDNLKVELIVQHLIGDAHGIVRYVRTPPSPLAQSP